MNITWLGQGGYLVEHDGDRVVIDPYLSDSLAAKGVCRMVSAPLRPEELDADFIICTHDHADHFDPATISATIGACPRTVVVGPASVIAHAVKIGMASNRLSELNVGDRKTFGAFTVIAVPAIHSDPKAVGLILAAGGTNIWFSGDSEYAPEVPAAALKAAEGKIDVVVICVNGRLGNMRLEDAVKAATAAKPKVALPSHYGMFASNTVDPAPFVEAMRQAGVGSFTHELGVAFEAR
jgi:L-ascorbate metabolism protein UlaG (beta-lactamase superfamily)